jgi:DNA-binding MarR family transcriptional regulator
MGLTPPQFDVMAELGGTPGMTCVELSQSTLLAKASLTGIIDRLEAKGLIERQVVPHDRRATHIRLTRKGETRYRKVFPAQANVMRPYFEHALTKQEIAVMQDMLVRLRESCQKETML